MSEIVAAVATSHTPMLVVPGERWGELGARDPLNQELFTFDGRLVSYDDLIQTHGTVEVPSSQVWAEQAQVCQASLDRLREHLAAADPDVVVIVGDDQKELFTPALQPTIAVFAGESFSMKVPSTAPASELAGMIREGYGMARPGTFSSHPKLARDIIAGFIASGVDVASSESEPVGHGFGHAYGFVLKRLLGEPPAPVVPILLNTFYPPNQPSPRRCVQFGEALRRAIESADPSLRVAVVASGGLSHFVTNQDLDAAVLTAIAAGDLEALAALPTEQLEGGASEIRNWITVASVSGDRDVAFCQYVPGIRSEAGTGVGMAFVAWS